MDASSCTRPARSTTETWGASNTGFHHKKRSPCDAKRRHSAAFARAIEVAGCLDVSFGLVGRLGHTGRGARPFGCRLIVPDPVFLHQTLEAGDPFFGVITAGRHLTPSRT